MRQGIKYSIVSYVFILVSIAAALFLFPNNIDLYGTLTFFVDSSLLIAPVMLLGSSAASVKFYPEIKDRLESGNVLLSSGFIAISISLVIFIIIGLVFYSFFYEVYAEKSQLINLGEYLWLLVPLITLICLHNFLVLHISNFKLITIPRLIQSSWRVSLPVIFILTWLDVVSISFGLWLLLGHFFIAVLLLFAYLHKLDRLKINFGKATMSYVSRKDVQVYAAFALLTSLGSSLAFKLDTFMVTTILDTNSSGIYSIGSRISSVIIVPASAILGIATPIISRAMKDRKFSEVRSIYVRSSEILTIAGVFMLSGLAVIVHDLFKVMSTGDEMLASGAIYVVGLVALARFADMITSVNSHIISMSEQFRYNIFFLIVLALLNMVLNIILIPIMGIKGAALATFISLFTFNLMKVIFIKVRFNMWPFSWKTLLIIAIGISSVLLVNQLATLVELPMLVEMCVKGAFVVVLIFSILYFLNVSSDFTHVVKVAIRRAKSLL